MQAIEQRDRRRIIAVDTAARRNAATSACRQHPGTSDGTALSEASGAWLGLRAIVHAQRALDGHTVLDDFALAPTVLTHADHPFAARLLAEAGRNIDAMVAALDAGENLPVALCGGLALPMAKYVGAEVRARLVPPAGDSVDGALHLASMAAAQSSSVPR